MRNIWVVKNAKLKQVKELADVVSISDKIIFVGNPFFVTNTSSSWWFNSAPNKVLLPLKSYKIPRGWYRQILQPDSGIRVRYPKYDNKFNFKVGICNKGTLKYCGTTINVESIPEGSVWRFDQLMDYLYAGA